MEVIYSHSEQGYDSSDRVLGQKEGPAYFHTRAFIATKLIGGNTN